MKKLLFMVYSMRLGGVEKSLVDLLKALSQNNEIQITLLLLEKEGEFLDRLPQSVEVKQCVLPFDIYLETTKATREGITEALKQGNIRTAFQLLSDCLRHKGHDQQEVLEDNYHRWAMRISGEMEKYDIAVDYQGMGFFPTYYVANYIDAERKYTWIHNDISVMPENMDWQKQIYDNYDKVYCVSKQVMKATALKMPFTAEKLDTFYNIIPVDEIIRQSQLPCEELKGKCKILTIGRLSFQKGYDGAFRVISRLAKCGYDIDYFVIGEGEQRIELEKLINELKINDRIHLLGYQSNPYKYLKQCDIYFQPSRFEGFCITLGEAKIFYKPIVTTDFAGAKEQIENNVTGMIVPCDEDKMFKALLEMVKNPSLRKCYEEHLKNVNKSDNNDVNKLFVG
jgi:glycosyltransferase involved in cell wall biosynthesis